MLTPTSIQNIRIAVSYFCNLRCKHCYVPEDDRFSYKQLEKDQLSVDQINKFVDFLVANFDLKKVTITGGEALLSNVWPRTIEVLQHALNRDLDIQLNTSGSGDIEMATIKEAAGDKYKKILMHMSLDGIDEDAVDEFRGKKGAMAKAMKSITDAVNLGLNVQARYTVTSTNIADAPACYDILNEIGVHSFMIKPMLPAGNAMINSDMILSKDDVRELQQELLRRSVTHRTRLDLPSPVYVKKSEIPAGANATIILCICGVEAGYIAYNGDVFPCTYIVGSPFSQSYVLGNIKDPDFDFGKVWVDPNSFAEYRQAHPEACTTHNILYRDMAMENMYHMHMPGICIS